MMFSAILSFLGGSVFRTIWGEVANWFTERQNQKYEIERMRVQEEIEAAQHARNLESLRLQAELGVKTIAVQAEADLSRLDAEGFYANAREAMKPTGIWIVDLWNGIVRPLCATIAIILWVGALNEAGWKMSDWDKELVGVILGFFFASRELSKRGK